MILRVFTVFDSKANAYLPPFCFGHIGEAVRAFIDAAQSTDHKFYKHGQDYTLYSVGHFDDSKGTFELLDAPEMVGRADIMRKQHQAMLDKQQINPEILKEA